MCHLPLAGRSKNSKGIFWVGGTPPQRFSEKKFTAI